MVDRPPEYVTGTCPVCGSATRREAAVRCKLRSDETGERYCRGAADERDHADGRLRFPNPAFGAWLDDRIAKDFPNG